MMGFGIIIQSLINKTITNIISFELSIDPLIEKFKKQCPPQDEIEKIIIQKNQLSQALTQTQKSITALNKTSNTVDKTLKTINVSIKIIKLSPIPSAVPPGIGIPMNIIIGFTDLLENLKILIEKGGGVTKQIKKTSLILLELLNRVKNRLSTLESLIVGCLENNTKNMNLQEKEDYYKTLGLNLMKNDVVTPHEINKSNNFNYKEFKITIETNNQNPFSFPQRRAIANHIKNQKTIIGPFSYSSSTQVLIDSIKFEIDKYLSL